MTPCSKNDCSNPLGRSIYLKFLHNVSKGHKKFRNFGNHRWKGSRVLSDSLMVGAKKPPSSIGNRVNTLYLNNEVSVSDGIRSLKKKFMYNIRLLYFFHLLKESII